MVCALPTHQCNTKYGFRWYLIQIQICYYFFFFKQTKDASIDEIKAKLQGSETELSAVRIQLEEFHNVKQTLVNQLSDLNKQMDKEKSDVKLEKEKLDVEISQLRAKLSAAKQVRTLDHV